MMDNDFDISVKKIIAEIGVICEPNGSDAHNIACKQLKQLELIENIHFKESDCRTELLQVFHNAYALNQEISYSLNRMQKQLHEENKKYKK